MIVVDASIAVKWLLRESESPAALAFARRAGIDLHAPDTLLAEVAGAIVRRANERSMSHEEASGALNLWTSGWQAGRITSYRLDASLAARSAATAMILAHPLPDCIYLALAMELRCELATADVKFRDRALPLYPEIRLLGEYV